MPACPLRKTNGLKPCGNTSTNAPYAEHQIRRIIPTCALSRAALFEPLYSGLKLVLFVQIIIQLFACVYVKGFMKAKPKPIDDRERAVVDLWEKGHLCFITIQTYLQWVRRFRFYCNKENLIEAEQLTLVGVSRFTRHYIGPRLKNKPISRSGCAIASNALHAWACALRRWEYYCRSGATLKNGPFCRLCSMNIAHIARLTMALRIVQYAGTSIRPVHFWRCCGVSVDRSKNRQWLILMRS